MIRRSGRFGFKSRMKRSASGVSIGPTPWVLGSTPRENTAYREISASLRRQLRPTLMFARQKAFSITRCIRTHPDDSRPGIHPLVLGLQPPSAPVVVDARRTDQLARIWGGRQGTTQRCHSQFEADPQRGSLTQPNVGRALSESTLGTSAEDNQVGKPTGSAFSPPPSTPPPQTDAMSCAA